MYSMYRMCKKLVVLKHGVLLLFSVLLTSTLLTRNLFANVSIYEMKDTFNILAPGYAHLSPLNGMILWEQGVVKNYYTYLRMPDQLFQMHRGQFSITRHGQNIVRFFDTYMVGEILGTIEKFRIENRLPLAFRVPARAHAQADAEMQKEFLKANLRSKLGTYFDGNVILTERFQEVAHEAPEVYDFDSAKINFINAIIDILDKSGFFFVSVDPVDPINPNVDSTTDLTNRVFRRPDSSQKFISFLPYFMLEAFAYKVANNRADLYLYFEGIMNSLGTELPIFKSGLSFSIADRYQDSDFDSRLVPEDPRDPAQDLPSLRAFFHIVSKERLWNHYEKFACATALGISHPITIQNATNFNMTSFGAQSDIDFALFPCVASMGSCRGPTGDISLTVPDALTLHLLLSSDIDDQRAMFISMLENKVEGLVDNGPLLEIAAQMALSGIRDTQTTYRASTSLVLLDLLNKNKKYDGAFNNVILSAAIDRLRYHEHFFLHVIAVTKILESFVDKGIGLQEIGDAIADRLVSDANSVTVQLSQSSLKRINKLSKKISEHLGLARRY
ncbi:MAG: hypothetical protein HQK53_17010 [Oligoflexia bacterium]|nr:hypothetical protein [Oligoflexia bacterium]